MKSEKLFCTMTTQIISDDQLCEKCSGVIIFLHVVTVKRKTPRPTRVVDGPIHRVQLVRYIWHLTKCHVFVTSYNQYETKSSFSGHVSIIFTSNVDGFARSILLSLEKLKSYNLNRGHSPLSHDTAMTHMI